MFYLFSYSLKATHALAAQQKLLVHFPPLSDVTELHLTPIVKLNLLFLIFPKTGSRSDAKERHFLTFSTFLCDTCVFRPALMLKLNLYLFLYFKKPSHDLAEQGTAHIPQTKNILPLRQGIPIKPSPPDQAKTC